jgi:hypothetical protein
VVAIIFEPSRKTVPDKGEWQISLSGGAGERDGGIRKLDGGIRRLDGGIRRLDGGIRRLDSGIRKWDGIEKLVGGFNFLQNVGSSLNGTFDA